MKKTYYHICRDVRKQPTEKFEPRVPESVLEEEDSSTPRICLSETIEGCLSAAPWGGVFLEESISDFLDEFGQDDYLISFRVYEFEDVPESKITTSKDLVKKGLVMDAEITKEVWVRDHVLNPSKSYVVGLESYFEEAEDVLSCGYYEDIKEDENLDVSEYIIGTTNLYYNVELEKVTLEKLESAM